ncbi:MAG: MFS transporter [Acidobacteriota bacterium]
MKTPPDRPPTADASARGDTLRAVVLPSLFLMVAMFNLTLIVAGLKELMIDDLGGTTADASLFFSIEMLAYILFAPLWGLLSDRWRLRRPFVAFGFFASGLCYLAYTSINDLNQLLMLRFAQGAFSVMGWSTLMAMVSDHPDEERRGRNMGIMGAGLIFGISIGAPIGGYISRELGTRAPLTVAGVLFLVLAAGAFLIPKNVATSRPLGLGDMARTLARCPKLLLPYLFQFADRYTVGFFIVLFPQYLATLGVSDPAVRGRYLALFLLPFAFLQYFTGRLSERIGPIWPLLTGSAIYGVVLCWVGVSSLYELWWVMAALGVLASVMFPPAMALTAQLSPPEIRGSAMGGFNLAGSLGFAVGPLVGNAVFERHGFAVAFISAGAVELAVVLGAGVALLWWRRA